jgi:hypothetical protein
MTMKLPQDEERAKLCVSLHSIMTSAQDAIEDAMPNAVSVIVDITWLENVVGELKRSIQFIGDRLSTVHSQVRIPLVITDADLESDTAQLVTDFAQALAEKLLVAQQKYGYSNGWMRRDWMDYCRGKLREHLEKGDPRDVAAYCAFLWFHGESTATEQSKGVSSTNIMR